MKPLLCQHGCQLLARRLGQLRVVQREADRRLDQAQMGATVETRAFEAVGIDGIALQQLRDRVGQLDLATSAGAGRFQQREDLRAEHVAADHGQVAGRVFRLGLLDDLRDAALRPSNVSVATMP